MNRTLVGLSRIAAVAAIASILLVGCQTPPETVIVKRDDPGVYDALTGAIKRADEQRAIADAAKQPAVLAGDHLKVIWEGEAKEILKKIAVAQGLQFRVTGPRPALAMPVFINIKSATLNETLAAIGDQLGGRGDVILNDSGIELRTKLY